jgi:hypothetical protein
MYRDRLTPSEQIVLDVYREHLEEYRQTLRVAKTSRREGIESTAGGDGVRDTGVVPVGMSVNPGVDVVNYPPRTSGPTADAEEGPRATGKPESLAHGPPPRLGLERGPVYGSVSWRDSATDKEKARWLLRLSREQIYKGHFDVAEQAIAEAKAMDVKWTVFDETPEKMTEALLKAKEKKANDTTDPMDQPHDRQAAKTRLRDARAALAAGEYDRAETIAREVGTWRLRYGFFEDTPDKVSAAISDARRRGYSQKPQPMIKPFRSTLPDPTMSLSPPSSSESR